MCLFVSDTSDATSIPAKRSRTVGTAPSHWGDSTRSTARPVGVTADESA
jgi:hypothetical protein